MLVDGLMQGNLSQAKMLKTHLAILCTILIFRQFALVVPNTSRFAVNFTKSPCVTQSPSHFSFLILSTMTSSLRNSVHRRNHKERSQLAHRSKLGLLEKHADYVKRARDYHSKQDRLTRLKQKVAERNKDEFYFSMTKEKTKVRRIFRISTYGPFFFNCVYRVVCISKTGGMSLCLPTLSRCLKRKMRTTSALCERQVSRCIP